MNAKMLALVVSLPMWASKGEESREIAGWRAAFLYH